MVHGNTFQHEFMVSVFHTGPFLFFFFPGAGLEYAKKSINKQHDLYHLVHIPVILFVPCVMTRYLDVDLASTVSSSRANSMSYSPLYWQCFRCFASGRYSVNFCCE